MQYISEKAINEKLKTLLQEVATGFSDMVVEDKNKVLRMVKANITFESEGPKDALDIIEENLNQKLSKYSSNDIFFDAIKEEVVKKHETPKKQKSVIPTISPSIVRMTQ